MIGPKWLFDIDTLTKSMNYQPVIKGNQLYDNAGVKENIDACKVRKKIVSAQQYVLPLWSTGSQDPQNTYADVAFDVKENENDVHVSANGNDKTGNKKHDEKSKRDDKGKSHVDLLTGVRDLRAEFKAFSFNSTNRANAVSAPVNAIGSNLTNSTNTFNTASLSVNAVSLNFGITRKSSFVDPSKYPDDPDMPELEDIVYLDNKEHVGVEADFSNLETNIFGRTQEEGIDYDELFTPVARIEAIRLFLAYPSFIGFMELCKAFEKLMKDKFQMSSMGELTFFLGLQVKQKNDGIFISQDKYVAKILRKFNFTDVKSASTPIETEKPLLKDPDSKDVDVHIYRSMIGSLMYLTLSKLDIMFVVCACVRFQLTLKVSHLHAVKKNLVTMLELDLIGSPQQEAEEEEEEDEMPIAPSPPLEDPTPTPHVTPPQDHPSTRPASPPHEQPTTNSKSSMSLLTTLMETCASLSQKVAELENNKHTQALEILKLKKRVKKLEKKIRLKSSGGCIQIGRKIEAIDADEDITLVDVEKDEEYPIIDWEIHTEGSRTYWKIIRVWGITKAYQSFEDILKGFDIEDLVALWNLVKEKFSSAVPSVDKEKALWVELKRLFEPDTYDLLWKLQRKRLSLVKCCHDPDAECKITI
uniref:Reverse transcriptase Ty1/copia-type domain-containing protein n=1 Tax=Tanacetum cinerariifolium TaxID=118510 RepID=A0A6L2L115_TANCI|nr:hypothetical protein [Tanacetum cinerariifolium]